MSYSPLLNPLFFFDRISLSKAQIKINRLPCSPSSLKQSSSLFVIISGATTFVVRSSSLITNIVPFTSTLVGAGSDPFEVRGKGDLNLGHLTLPALLVPELIVNVISVGELAEKLDSVVFGKKEVKAFRN